MEQSGSDDSRYAFILGGDKKSSVRLPSLNLPRPLGIGLLIFFVVILIFILLLLVSSKSSPFTKIAARQKEIARVAVVAGGSAQSQNVKDLVSTVDAVFSTEESQSAKALGISANSSKLNLYYSRTTDSQLKTASQNNFDQTYLQILKTQLTDYSQALVATSKQLPTNSNLQTLLTADYNDAQTLLGDPAFKNL